MQIEKVIPILRIFDYAKAKEFYVDWLGFTVEWEHHFHEGAPVYFEVSKGDITLHLSEHHGDGAPSSHVFIWCVGVADYHKELIDKQYKYNLPSIDKTFYGALTFVVIDPFNNRISFNERLDDK